MSNTTEFKITRICPYNKEIVDVVNCWYCKLMTTHSGCILDSEKLKTQK